MSAKLRQAPCGWVKRLVIWAKSRSVQRVAMLTGLLVVAIVAVVAFNATRTMFNSEILPPATVPPVAGLCTEQLQHSPDGTVSPLFCPGGEINTLAWSYLATNNLQVMGLGRSAGPGEVRAAIAQDLRTHASGPVECNAALLAAAYYGWDFHIDPVDGLSLGCAIVR